MTRDEVTRLLAFLAEVYPNTRQPEHPQDRIDVWHSMLADWDGEQVALAAREVALSDQFHPSIARLVEELAPVGLARLHQFQRRQARQKALGA